MSPLVLFKNAWSVGGRKRFENIAAWPARSLSPRTSKHTNHLVSIRGFIPAKTSHEQELWSIGFVAVAVVGVLFAAIAASSGLLLVRLCACYWAYLIWFLTSRFSPFPSYFSVAMFMCVFSVFISFFFHKGADVPLRKSAGPTKTNHTKSFGSSLRT